MTRITIIGGITFAIKRFTAINGAYLPGIQNAGSRISPAFVRNHFIQHSTQGNPFMTIEIRQENPSDISAIHEVHKSAFGKDNEARLVDLLRSSDAFIPGLSIVAAMNDEILGHILFTNIKIVNEQGTEFESLALAPVAVRKDVQKQGIGGQLIRFGLERARESGYKSVIVLGHENYYPKFGFAPAEKWNIRSPYDVPSSVFMAIELVENGLDGVTGLVKYPKEFEVV